MREYGFKQVVATPTRITEVSSTIIDLIFCNFEVAHEVWNRITVTDHAMLVIKFRKSWRENVEQQEESSYRDFTKFQENIFSGKLRQEICNIYSVPNEVDKDKDAIVSANKVIDVMTTVLNDVAPWKKKVRKLKWHDNKWFDKDIKVGIRNRDRAYKIARADNNQQDWIYYRQCRNKVVSLIRKKKNSIMKEQSMITRISRRKCGRC